MFGGRQHQSQTQHPFDKQQEKPQSYQEMVTAIKKAEGTIYTQMTPRPNKKILLLDENKGKHLFPLVRDREIGINCNSIGSIKSTKYNDDDKQTSSTQLQRGMIQTLQDLYEVIEDNENNL